MAGILRYVKSFLVSGMFLIANDWTENSYVYDLFWKVVVTGVLLVRETEEKIGDRIGE